MFDSVSGAQVMPNGNYAYAGYVNGHWPNYQNLVQTFLGKSVLSIAVTSDADADCLDIEKGDAVNADAPAWVQRQLSRGLYHPCLYTSVSNMDALLAVLSAAHIQRNTVRLWSAHYGHGEHICGPLTCGLCSVTVDGTQWTDQALGRNLDQSILLDNFFQRSIVLPDFNPPIVMEPWVSALACPSGGAWGLAADGSVYAVAGAPFYGAAHGQPYFAGRTAAKLVTPDPDEAAAGKHYTVVAGSGERYAYPEG